MNIPRVNFDTKQNILRNNKNDEHTIELHVFAFYSVCIEKQQQQDEDGDSVVMIDLLFETNTKSIIT